AQVHCRIMPSRTPTIVAQRRFLTTLSMPAAAQDRNGDRRQDHLAQPQLPALRLDGIIGLS
ncbi:hypothetical protein ACFLWA_10290, partial [Chloroflexota bacterium]